MAAAEKQRYGNYGRHSSYGSGAVFGSLAYDFNNPEIYDPEEYGTGEEQRAKPQAGAHQARKVRTRAKPSEVSRQAIAPSAVIGFAAAAVLCVLGITAQVQLFSLSGESLALEQRAAELQEERDKLRISYESAFNLAEIEDYATNSLGMQKPGADQISYIDTSAPDKAVVLGNGTSDGLVDTVADFLSGVEEYLE